jgi:hypothetical protein
MHQPVKDRLEEYLRGVGGGFQKPLPPDFENHLEACGECSAELSEFERHTTALRSLRAPQDAEPKSGFYARVRQRIDEARATSSVWAAFLEPLFAKRLAIASAALVVLLGTYLVSTERGDLSRTHNSAAVVVNAGPDDVDSTTPQERDAVLAKLVYYGE